MSLGILLALVAAFTTASSHALLKAGRDGLAVRAVCSLVWFVVAAVPAALVGLPDRALWPWLAGAVLLHGVYSLVLTRSYALNDFSVAFPIARGVAPALTAIAGIVVLGDRVSLVALAGILAVSGGIVALVQGRELGRDGLLAALTAGTLTAAYTVVDAGGMRASEGPFDFIVWFFLLLGAVLVAQFLLARRGGAVAAMRADARIGLAAGFASLLSFGATLFALRYAPVGTVSALRECCVLVSLGIGARLFGEEVTPRRIAAAIAIVAGALVIIAASLGKPPVSG